MNQLEQEIRQLTQRLATVPIHSHEAADIRQALRGLRAQVEHALETLKTLV